MRTFFAPSGNWRKGILDKADGERERKTAALAIPIIDQSTEFNSLGSGKIEKLKKTLRLMRFLFLWAHFLRQFLPIIEERKAARGIIHRRVTIRHTIPPAYVPQWSYRNGAHPTYFPLRPPEPEAKRGGERGELLANRR